MPNHANLFQNPSLFRIAHVRGEQAARADANKKEQGHTSRHGVASLSLVYRQFLSIALTARPQETCFGRRSWRWLQIGGNREHINPAGWH